MGNVTPEFEAVAFAIWSAGYMTPSEIERGVAADLWSRNFYSEEMSRARVQARAALLAIRRPSNGALDGFHDVAANQRETLEGWRDGFAAVIDRILAEKRN